MMMLKALFIACGSRSQLPSRKPSTRVVGTWCSTPFLSLVASGERSRFDVAPVGAVAFSTTSHEAHFASTMCN